MYIRRGFEPLLFCYFARKVLWELTGIMYTGGSTGASQDHVLGKVLHGCKVRIAPTSHVSIFAFHGFFVNEM